MTAQVQQVKDPNKVQQATKGPDSQTKKDITKFAEGLVEALSTVLNPSGAGMMQKQLTNHAPSTPTKDSLVTLILPARPAADKAQAADPVAAIMQDLRAKLNSPLFAEKLAPKIEHEAPTTAASNKIAFANKAA